MNINIGDKRYIISDAAKLIDVESHVLRYWEEELEVEVPRNEMGHRYYTDYYIELFKRIKELKDSGFQLKAIKMLLPDLMNMDEDVRGNDHIGVMKEELFGRLLAIDGGEAAQRQQSGEMTTKEAVEERAQRSDEQQSGEAAGKEAVEEKAQRSDEQQSGEAAGKEAVEEKAQRAEERQSGEAAGKEAVGEKAQRSGVQQEEEARENTALGEAQTGGVSQNVVDNSKLQQFQMIITEVVSNALKENTGALGQEVGEIVSDNVIKEMDYLMTLREKQEEERFKKLDETIRSYQNSNREKTKSGKGILSKFKR